MTGSGPRTAAMHSPYRNLAAITAPRRAARLFLLTVLTALPLAACSQSKNVTWREEVKLANGQVIVVRRSQDYRRAYAGGGGPGWLFDYERVTATLPTSHVDVSWEGRLKPLALDIALNGDVYLVAVVANLAGRKEYAVPEGSYHVGFKRDANGRWARVPLNTVPPVFRPNIMAGTYGLFIDKGSTIDFVDLASKASVDSDPRLVKWYRDWPRN